MVSAACTAEALNIQDTWSNQKVHITTGQASTRYSGTWGREWTALVTVKFSDRMEERYALSQQSAKASLTRGESRILHYCRTGLPGQREASEDTQPGLGCLHSSALAGRRSDWTLGTRVGRGP